MSNKSIDIHHLPVVENVRDYPIKSEGSKGLKVVSWNLPSSIASSVSVNIKTPKVFIAFDDIKSEKFLIGKFFNKNIKFDVAYLTIIDSDTWVNNGDWFIDIGCMKESYSDNEIVTNDYTREFLKNQFITPSRPEILETSLFGGTHTDTTWPSWSYPQFPLVPLIIYPIKRIIPIKLDGINYYARLTFFDYGYGEEATPWITDGFIDIDGTDFNELLKKGELPINIAWIDLTTDGLNFPGNVIRLFIDRIKIDLRNF